MVNISSRALILAIVGMAAVTTAFAPPPMTAHLGRWSRDMPHEVLRTRVERSASFNQGDSAIGTLAKRASPATPASPNPRAWGWTHVRAIPPQQQRKGDLSKLFAKPEPESAQGRPLVGLSRGCMASAQGSCGSSPIFFSICALCSVFSPILAVQSVVAWGVGRAAYWWSMRGADVSQRLPAGFVGYMSLFLLVGGVSFLNGLKAIALLA